MPSDFLHRHKEFPDLIRIVGEERSIDPVLVEKDYWIMHCLYGLQQMGLSFELKGGTSLSKGLGVIGRFSEDIDIRIEPPAGLKVAVNPNRQKPRYVKSRRRFYDRLAGEIAIDGIAAVERDTTFDDERYYRSGGIRLRYDSHVGSLSGIRDGVLLELGFDTVNPNSPCTISSWAYDHAADKVEIRDNRAVDVACYHPGYTFVEKLQTISTKFRKQQESANPPDEFMRQYHDVYRLLDAPQVQKLIEYGARRVNMQIPSTPSRFYLEHRVRSPRIAHLVALLQGVAGNGELSSLSRRTPTCSRFIAPRQSQVSQGGGCAEVVGPKLVNGASPFTDATPPGLGHPASCGVAIDSAVDHRLRGRGRKRVGCNLLHDDNAIDRHHACCSCITATGCVQVPSRLPDPGAWRLFTCCLGTGNGAYMAALSRFADVRSEAGILSEKFRGTRPVLFASTVAVHCLLFQNRLRLPSAISAI